MIPVDDNPAAEAPNWLGFMERIFGGRRELMSFMQRAAGYAPTGAKQDTVVRWDEDEKVVCLWSASPVTWRKLARLGIETHRETRGWPGDRALLPGGSGPVPLEPQVGPRRPPGQPRQRPSTVRRPRQ